jgi:hypothetical protein
MRATSEGPRTFFRLAVLLALAGCGGGAPAETETPTPAPVAADQTPTPATASTELAAPVDRSRGAVRGGFELEVQRVSVGAPLLFHFWVENTGAEPIVFREGGDSYGHGPASYTFLVLDGAGNVECDLRGRPEPGAGGGGSSIVIVALGARWERWLLGQMSCPAFATAGRHHVRIVRILLDRHAAPASCGSEYVPDTTVEPLDDRGVPLDPACRAFHTAAPAIATEMDVELLAYDREAVRTAVRAAIAAEPSRHGDNSLLGYAEWLGDVLGREHQYDLATDVLLTQLMAALPETWPSGH